MIAPYFRPLPNGICGSTGWLKLGDSSSKVAGNIQAIFQVKKVRLIREYIRYPLTFLLLQNVSNIPFTARTTYSIITRFPKFFSNCMIHKHLSSQPTCKLAALHWLDVGSVDVDLICLAKPCMMFQRVEPVLLYCTTYQKCFQLKHLVCERHFGKHNLILTSHYFRIVGFALHNCLLRLGWNHRCLTIRPWNTISAHNFVLYLKACVVVDFICCFFPFNYINAHAFTM